jgi:hypothetical protein
MLEKRKLEDSELNIWLKELNDSKKETFLENLWNNDLIWSSALDKSDRKNRFNNYRYKQVSTPNHPTKILIYITALSVEPKLKISTIFPDIEQEYISYLLPILLDLSKQVNSFKNAEN